METLCQPQIITSDTEYSCHDISSLLNESTTAFGIQETESI